MRMNDTAEMICLGLAILVGSATLGVAEGGVAEGGAMGGDMRGHGPRHSFEALDINGDGKIVVSELEAHHLARFTAADGNGDGVLSEAELLGAAQRRAAKRVARMIRRHDGDGDGQLSLSEMQAGYGRHGRHFARMDTDADGAVTKAEFEAGRKHRFKHGRHGKTHSAEE